MRRKSGCLIRSWCGYDPCPADVGGVAPVFALCAASWAAVASVPPGWVWRNMGRLGAFQRGTKKSRTKHWRFIAPVQTTTARSAGSLRRLERRFSAYRIAPVALLFGNHPCSLTATGNQLALL
ncbi:hypothetical protein [Oscillibacter sp.]|uniref:hypothetical protein n=1 Tax=Oscillibacter sp. TaxID=1945593 RepID=UPI0028AE9737|nr:hypothetical protein [Oscillibacter sp.]